MMKLPSFPRRRWLVGLLLGGCGCAAAAAMSLFWTGRAAGVGVTTTVRRSAVVVKLTEAGVLRPAESLTYRSGLVGRELEITFLAPEGTYVKTGDLLAQLDSTALVKELERAIDTVRQTEVDTKAADADRADAAAAIESATEGSGALDVEEAAAKLRLAERNVERLRAEYEGLKPLLEKGFITRDELDRAAFDLDQADTELSFMRKRAALLASKTRPRDEQRARVQLDQREAQVSNAKQRLKDAVAQVTTLREAIASCSIRATYGGLVVYEEFLGVSPRRRVRVGDRVSASQGLVTIPEVERMLVDTSVREADLWRARVGLPVSIAVDAYPSLKLAGQVVAIGTAARLAERPFEEKRFGVTIAIDGANRDLRPDMTARAEIIVADRQQVLTVPVSALSKRGDAWTVSVLVRSGLETRTVTVGENNGFDAEILGGLREGDRVSLTPPPAETRR